MSRGEREGRKIEREGEGGGIRVKERAFVRIISFVRVLCLYLCCN